MLPPGNKDRAELRSVPSLLRACQFALTSCSGSQESEIPTLRAVKNDKTGGVCLAQSEKGATLDLAVMSSSPMLGVKIIYINKLVKSDKNELGGSKCHLFGGNLGNLGFGTSQP